MSCCNNEIIGIKYLALYENKGLQFRWPDISKENEVDIINHESQTIIVDCSNELPTWERIIDYSANYKQNYQDIFRFYLHGILNDNPEILQKLRESRVGWVAEIITKDDNSLVFPTPVFVSEPYNKAENSHTNQVIMQYRVPTFKNYYKKLNTLIMSQSFIIVDENKVLGTGINPISS